MDAAQVVETLRNLGVSLKAEGSKLLMEPGSRVPPDLVPDIRRRKQEILDLLADSSQHHDEDTARLLAWASRAAEDGLTLAEPVQFLEGPLRPRTTNEVGRFCRDQLRYLSMARSNRATGGWGRFTPEWWTELEASTIQSMAALKAAVDQTQHQE